jgi:hypothetical protein
MFLWMADFSLYVRSMPISPLNTPAIVAIVLEARRALARLYTFIRRKYDATVRTTVHVGTTIRRQVQRFYKSKSWVKKSLLWIGVLLLLFFGLPIRL